jgi:hypothetical protein
LDGAVACSPSSIREPPIPTAVGLERDGETLIRSFCPPYYPNMKDAVLALVNAKFAPGKGAFRDGGAETAWLDGKRVTERIPQYSGSAVQATIDYCEYVYARYGRFPAACGPFRTVLAYQAHRLDPDFYTRFHRPEFA